ncbi:hypothetical protein Tco_1342771 [Tanacetum coccineum]
MKSLNSNFQERELYQLQQMQDKEKESCMISFRLLHLHLKTVDAEHKDDTSNQTQAVNSDSLKVDLVVKQNSCSEKEDSNSETASSKSAKECSLNSETQDVHAIKYKIRLVQTQQCTDDNAVREWIQMLMMQISEPIMLEEQWLSPIDCGICNIFAIGSQHTVQPEIIIWKLRFRKKVFAIAALKNDLRKLKGNSVDTKFDKASILGKPVLPSVRNQSVVRQPNAFKSARAQMSKQRFASQVDVNKNLSKPVTQHYLPKKTESAFAKPDHVIASSSSRNSSKNMLRFSSNDMVHNHYLDEARKKDTRKR